VDEHQTWEPWQPQVGQRVRLRLSPECSWCRPRQRWHGERGTVTSIGEAPPDVSVPGSFSQRYFAHRYTVRLDLPRADGFAAAYGGSFAAAELEPVGADE
jgi:hypothetical protein